MQLSNRNEKHGIIFWYKIWIFELWYKKWEGAFITILRGKLHCIAPIVLTFLQERIVSIKTINQSIFIRLYVCMLRIRWNVRRLHIFLFPLTNPRFDTKLQDHPSHSLCSTHVISHIILCLKNNKLCYKGARAKKSFTARFASPWATASSGSGIHRVDAETCKFKMFHQVKISHSISRLILLNQFME